MLLKGICEVDLSGDYCKRYTPNSSREDEGDVYMYNNDKYTDKLDFVNSHLTSVVLENRVYEVVHMGFLFVKKVEVSCYWLKSFKL